MIIVSQNKGVIININAIACIQTSAENIGNIEVVLFNKIDCHNGLTVGEYQTDERAKEVLQEIIRKCQNFRNDMCYIVYEMPKE